ncbi:MAG: ATP-binding protein, partial [Eggerthellaceae bacterium]|nr:ATP-binding protein [Eggerthellaceae bacterium]
LLMWVQNPTDGIVLTGGIGIGKTWTACAVMQAYMDWWKCSGKFVTAAEYVQLCREFEGHFAEEYFSCGILVLDDLGKESPTRFATERIFDLIDRRHANCRKTIINSNYSARSLMERMVTEDDDTVAAKAFMSRLSRFTFAPMSGIDKRKEGRSDGE